MSIQSIKMAKDILQRLKKGKAVAVYTMDIDRYKKEFHEITGEKVRYTKHQKSADVYYLQLL